jgi:competence CoiA-like predicted nuclease
MKKILTVLSIVSFTFLFSQEETEYINNPLPAKYVLKTSKDTINTHVVGSYAFKKNHFTADTFLKNIKTENNEVKTKVSVETIKYLEITDFDRKVRKFINADRYPELRIGNRMLEILFQGKRILVLGEEYTINLYGNTAATFYTLDKRDLLKKSGKDKVLRERLEKYPDLLERYKKIKKDEDYYVLLTDYEKRLEDSLN